MTETAGAAFAVALATVAGVAGVALLVAIARRPALLWPSVFATAILGAGPMIAGYAVIDEWLLGCVVVGGLMAVGRGHVRRSPSLPRAIHPWAFLGMTLYGTVEAVRGALRVGDPAVVRWIAFYVVFAVLLVLTSQWTFPRPGPSTVTLVVAASAAIYLTAYVIDGIVTECGRGDWRWTVQGVEWAGSAYALVPGPLGVAAAIPLIGGPVRNVRVLGWMSLGLFVFALIYYDSRSGFFALVGLLALTPLVLDSRSALRVLSGAGLVFSIAFWFTSGPFGTPVCHEIIEGRVPPRQVYGALLDFSRLLRLTKTFGVGMAQTALLPVAPRSSDLDRVAHWRAGLDAVRSDWTTLTIGGGLYAHRTILRPYLERWNTRLLPDTRLPPVIRTTGIVALGVDTGMVGVALLLLLLALTIQAIITRAGPHWWTATLPAITVIQLPFWLAVSNIQDVVLYVLMLMPHGVTVSMVLPDPDPATPSTAS